MNARYSSQLEDALRRYDDSITRLEVHLGDENAGKQGDNDKRCMIEARIKGRDPVAVTQLAGTLDQAVHGATDKLLKSLSSALGHLRHT